jgi:prephenate dehydrogenase
MEIQKISILGLGLIGGSLAKAIGRSHPNHLIIGMDARQEYLDLALKEGVIHQCTTHPEKAVQGAHLIFLCTPVGIMPELLKKIADHIIKGAIITDVGSTKKNIVAAAQKYLPHDVFFVGGHPMTGTEYSGYKASIPHLFENAYYIITPHPSIPTGVVDYLTSFLSSIGAIPIVMDPLLHDEIVGCISHLPHIVAASLVNTVDEIEDSQHLIERLAAGGFRDITRIASSNPKMWKDISLANRQQLLNLLSAIIDNLAMFRKWLEYYNTEKIESYFLKAKKFRDNLPTLESLTLLPYHDLYIDVEDRPGIIGEIATLLGQHEINIKNLRIIHSREDEPGGCLVLSLSDGPSLKKAIQVLAEHNFKTYIR